MNENEFISELKLLNITISEYQLKQLNTYYNLLVEWNEKFNLTTIIDKESVYLKHFYDSLTLIKAIDLTKNIKICDVGTGAGFPGIVLKIIFPNLNVILLDSSEKKETFLKEVIRELNLDNIEVINERAEDYLRTNKEVFDLITCRAVSRLNIISEICLQGLKINGCFIPMKANIDEETKNIKFLKTLNSKLERVITFNLPKENSLRNLVIIRKYKSIDNKYPRNYSQIIKNPL